MLFTITATIDVIKDYRLQENGEWRELNKSYTLQEGDRTFERLWKTSPYWRENLGLVINEKKYSGNPTGPISLGDRTLAFLKPHIHRFERPREPQREDLIQKIAKANKNKIYSPIIDIRGNSDLVVWGNRSDPKRDYSIAVRTESLSNDYLGQAASQDVSFTSSTYKMLLDGWLTHLRTGKLNIYMDVGSNLSEEELLHQIRTETQKLPERAH